MSEALELMAGRAAGDPFFLAHPLAAFAQSERLDDPALAARLGCEVADLPRLRLCRAPRPDPADFRADVQAVAAAFGIDPRGLAAAVRHGEGLTRLRKEGRAAAAPGFLLAARDADPEPPPAEGGPP